MAYLIRARAETAEWGAYDASWGGQWSHVHQRWVGRDGSATNPEGNWGEGSLPPGSIEPPPVYHVSDDNRVRQVGFAEWDLLTTRSDPALVEVDEFQLQACERLKAESRVQQGYLQEV
jgi:hypothetical protein